MRRVRSVIAARRATTTCASAVAWCEWCERFAFCRSLLARGSHTLTHTPRFLSLTHRHAQNCRTHTHISLKIAMLLLSNTPRTRACTIGESTFSRYYLCVLAPLSSAARARTSDLEHARRVRLAEFHHRRLPLIIRHRRRHRRSIPIRTTTCIIRSCLHRLHVLL